MLNKNCDVKFTRRLYSEIAFFNTIYKYWHFHGNFHNFSFHFRTLAFCTPESIIFIKVIGRGRLFFSTELLTIKVLPSGNLHQTQKFYLVIIRSIGKKGFF